MAHRVAPRAAADLDDIWLYVARESGSMEIANRLIDTITERFYTLASFPYIGRSREDDFGPGYRSLAVGEYVIVYCVENEDALILRVVHGRRQSEALFGHLRILQ
jgi:toxin ParE1/3/4